jgi:transposase-like protein
MANGWRWWEGRVADWVRWRQVKGHGTKFARKKEAAIAALLSHRTLEEAARAVGISPNTLLRWQQDPEFDAAFRKARRATYGQTTARLHQASSVAVSAVLKIMVDPGAPASTRLRAADIVLAHTAKAIEIEDIEARVAELERAAEPAESSRR